jgi:hypothetical protein
MSVQSTHYRMHTQLPRHHRKGKHLLAFLVAPALVFTVVYAVWSVLKEQCTSLSTAQCLSAGSVSLGGTDVALLATFLAAGAAAIVEVVAD